MKKKSMISISRVLSVFILTFFLSCKDNYPPESADSKVISKVVNSGLDEKLIRYSPDADEKDKARARQSFMDQTGVNIIETRICSCDPNLVVWQGEKLKDIPSPSIPPMGGTCKANPTTGDGSPNLVIIDVNNNNKFDAPTINYESNPLPTPTNLGSVVPGTDNPTKIAIIDGLLNRDYINSIHLDREFIIDKESYDFVPGTNGDPDFYGANASNHQAMVLGFFAKQMIKVHKNRNFRLMILNVYDSNSEADVFSLTCALTHAHQKGAEVIITSLGYYLDTRDGDALLENTILKKAVEDLEQPVLPYNKVSMLVAAAGNGRGKHQSVDLEANLFFPACFSTDFEEEYKQREHVISVTSAELYTNNNDANDFYNVSGIYVDVAHGRVEAKYPNPFYGSIAGLLPQMRGTSFSTPIFAAEVANLLSQHIPPQKSIIFNHLQANSKINISHSKISTVNHKCYECP